MAARDIKQHRDIPVIAVGLINEASAGREDLLKNEEARSGLTHWRTSIL
ncbi:hypothetical protein O3W44_23685 [Pantoea sp. LMR881]|nr:hypothetical protein [Pantoea sp. LMR881]MCZ4061497.1 hypothetical protein [Pantoea sp. LMR881]